MLFCGISKISVTTRNINKDNAVEYPENVACSKPEHSGFMICKLVEHSLQA